MNAAEGKKAFRQQMRTILKTIPDKMARSNTFLSKIMDSEAFKQATCIMSYSPMPDEVQLQAFNDYVHLHKKLFLPRINGENIEAVPYTGKWTKAGSYGILEPDGEKVNDLLLLDLIIVPGLAFDKQNNRMGRGKAYYDRFLPNTQALKIGVCFVEQFVDFLPTDTFDISMDSVIVI